MSKTKKIPVKTEITPENKCSFCTESKCCTYVTQEIDAPRSMRDFDHLLWQVAHLNLQIYKDDDGWFLLINNACRHLQADGGCGVYETRPIVCREHDNDYCEYDAPAEEGFELFFEDYDALEKYCRGRFKSWDKRYDKA